MTTPAPSQEPNEGQPVKRRRGMVGFYVGMGVVVALLVAGHFACTPLRVWYWEKEVRRTTQERVAVPCDSVRELAAIGPAAMPAFRRLLARRSDTRTCVLRSVGGPDQGWLMPELAKLVKNDRDQTAQYCAIRAAERIGGRNFFSSDLGAKPAIGEVRKIFLTWWERTGKAKYGRSE